jgi:hypothetical protein
MRDLRAALKCQPKRSPSMSPGHVQRRPPIGAPPFRREPLWPARLKTASEEKPAGDFRSLSVISFPCRHDAFCAPFPPITMCAGWGGAPRPMTGPPSPTRFRASEGPLQVTSGASRFYRRTERPSPLPHAVLEKFQPQQPLDVSLQPLQ